MNNKTPMYTNTQSFPIQCRTMGHEGCKVIKGEKDGFWRKLRTQHIVYGRTVQEHHV